MSISGILCVWQSSAGGEQPQCSSVSVFPDCEEAFSPRWIGWSGILPVSCWDASVNAVLIQTASNQLHQVKYSPPPRVSVQRRLAAYCNFTCFFQTFARVHRGVWDNVAGLLPRYKAEPDTDKWRPWISHSHSECAEEETSASCSGNHWWADIYF